MRGPPLGPLLPLLLILNTTATNPESSHTSRRIQSEDVSSLKSLHPSTEHYGTVEEPPSVNNQWKVALENSTERSIQPEYPRERLPFTTENTTMAYGTVDTYQSVSNSVSKCVKCESNRQTRSDNSEDFVPSTRKYFTNSKNSGRIGLKILSQVLESASNGSNVQLETDSLVLSRNDTQISSLGSIDVIVPSITNGEGKNVELRRNISALFPNNVSSRNRSSNVLRLGRTDAPMLNYIFDTYSTLNKHNHRYDRFGGPKIESKGISLSVDTDAEAILDCRVTSLQDKMVSWVRRRPGDDNLELLTIGQHTYTADSRFAVDFRQPDNWRLVLSSARATDSGVYECQISTHPPLITRMELTVNAPIVSIVEAGGRELRDKYYERNSTLKLACRIRHLASQTPIVNWLHADRILNDDTLRGGVSVRTEAVAGGADSTLLVARLNSSDSGRYTCSVGADLFAVVNVHVLNGESLAELHQGVGSRIQGSFVSCLLPVTILTTFYVDHIFKGILQFFFFMAECSKLFARSKILTNV